MEVSFSTRIPNAFPLGDAMTMSTNVCLYNAYGCHLNYRDVLKPPAANKGPVNGPTITMNDAEPSTPLPSVIEEEADVNGPSSETSQQAPTGKVSSPKHGEPTNPIKHKDVAAPSGFCSELILWRVDAVGPLSKSGGVSELARINSLEISAFSNVAWIPTLLPSTTLGNLSNSPSACFVASDGKSLRVYQAVIDARTLLAEVSSSERRSRMMDSMVSLSTDTSSDDGLKHSSLHDKIKIVSQQSTARPGCVIQLDAISDATHDWQNTQFLHVFQEQLITGERAEEKTIGISEIGRENDLSLMETQLGAMVDLQQSAVFEEPFYIVVLERTNKGTVIHMWRLVIASQPEPTEMTGSMMYVPDSQLVQDDDELEPTGRSASTAGVDHLGQEDNPAPVQTSHVVITTTKPVLHHILLSLLVRIVPFWNCKSTKSGEKKRTYEWGEWEMIRKDPESTIDISGQPLNISAAYSGRIACAYKYGKSFTRPSKNDPDSRYVNLCVAIYECESTGVDPHLDLSYLYDSRFLQKKQRLNNILQTFSSEDVRLLAVPSFSTLQSLRKSIIECGNTCPLTQKHLVQLDWVSKEDGSHILTVGVGSKVMLFTPVSSDLAQANMKAMKESQSANRPILRKASSLAAPHFVDEIRWMKLRKIDLVTADGLPPLPMQISWVRDGILVVGMDSEMHVYSQWKPDFSVECERNGLHHQESEELQDTRNLRDEDLRNLAQETSQRRLANVSSMPHLSRVSSINLTMLDSKKKRGAIVQSDQMNSVDYMPDYGLFEASRIACPVLPQYHPKQLMELLNSGKIRWVKAILAHLVRCISGTCAIRQGGSTDEENLVRQRGWSRSRTLSVSYIGAGTTSPLEQRGSTTAIPEELTLDYAEITSIPPLPLWTLLAADKETPTMSAQMSEDQQDYNDLFDGNLADADESLDDLLEEEPDSPRRHDRRPSGRLLSRLLTHTHLPGLSSLDQMHLLALADTVSTCNTDFAERFAIDAAKTAIAKENLSGMPEGEDISTDSLDDCGLRFLLAMKHYNYLLRCLPIAQRAQFQRQGVGTNNLVWAFHSESEEELLNLIPSYAKGSPKWSILKELGVGWWLRNHTLLKTCIERVAKASYMAKQDPLDAAIFYLAMKKKSLVWGLFRSKRDDRMTHFFSNNFAEDRWRKAALKNAFALLGKQRFEHAAAFFLLAGALRDAIEVCLNKLEDFQLAMVIARLYEGELDSTPPNLRRLLYEEILGCDNEGGNQSLSEAHPDPFLRSMALWILKDHTGSLNTLLQTNTGSNHPQYSDSEDKFEGASANPNVFNFYVYLRTHPLLIRQYIASTAQDKRKAHAVVLSGFSYGAESKPGNTDKQLLLEDSITPLERQLYFTTAHAHFKAGCPALALEVLSKLPSKVMDANGDDSPSLLNSPSKARVQDYQIDTGILSWGDATDTQRNIDSSSSMELSTHVSSSMDWSQPMTRNEESLELKWDDDDDDEETEKQTQKPLEMKPTGLEEQANEELSTLATGFEVDGGQLRYHLYVWLEREVEALRQLCNYSFGDVESVTADEGIMDATQDLRDHNTTPTMMMRPGDKPTLHEILMAEKMDFEAKVQRAAKRKKWLKANETLLRTLLSYCSLHGASGGGLASVRMELVLLLQELQQEKTQQQLLSPLPFPTTLPLLSASVACNKTVVADPVRHLQAQAHDMLQTIVELRSPPMPSRTHFSEVFVLRDLAVALSACIYQSLCDSDTFSVKQQTDSYQSSGLESLARLNVVCPSSHLIASHTRRRRYSSDEPLQVTTHPCKWPGVTNLRALLAREKDEDTPRLSVLLCEAFVASYMSLIVYALATCDSLILYRLAGQKFSNQTWAMLFGGGVKKLLKVAASSNSGTQSQGSLERESSGGSEGGVWTTMTSLTKQRVRLNMKILGQFTNQPGTPLMKEDKPTYREQFISPEMSMVSYFLIKPQLPAEAAEGVDYDSADSAVSDLDDEEEEEDVFEGTTSSANPKVPDRENTEHSNPSSYSWCVMRLGIMKLVQQQLQEFLNVAGIEIQELPVCSPLIHGTLRVVSQWQDMLTEELDLRRPPPADYIPGCFDIFIRAVFGKRRSLSSMMETPSMTDGMKMPEDKGSDSGTSLPEPVRIIHKEQDSISAFCLNQVNVGLLALATPREVQEMDITLLLELPSWLEDECEFDIINLTKEPELLPASSFLVIQTTADRPMLAQAASTAQNYNSNPSSPQPGLGGQTGRGASVDGSVQMWEWGHVQAVSVPRPPGTFAKVTRVRFSEHGNKFGVADGDGNLSLWQVGLASNSSRPFFTYQCHNKVTSDFVFLGSCSMVATAGHSSESKNVALWDSLLPQKKALITAFSCHDQGASSLVYAPQHQLLISAGKKGDVCIVDVRQRQLRHRFQAHEHPIKCLAIDPGEEFFVTGSADGDIKFLQKHWPGSDPASCRLVFEAFLMRCRWVNEGATVARKRSSCTNAILKVILWWRAILLLSKEKSKVVFDDPEAAAFSVFFKNEITCMVLLFGSHIVSKDVCPQFSQYQTDGSYKESFQILSKKIF
ncbi:DmX-like protein 2 [Blattella germanica]|nr:DmX-like protein 2 [Blattella germanica]